MAIELVTGLPGNGKTLHTLARVKAWAEKDNRPVYYSGIRDLMLPWTEIDPEKWYDCPANSIIVIDECQRVFRPRSFGSNVPEYVSRLETHRHQGLDIVLITQHPMLCDPSIRRLAGKHLHVVRKFGMAAATIHEWGSVRENCDKPSGRADSVKHHWKYDKSAYQFYKSAETHTVKRNIPFRLYVLFVFIPLILAFLGYRFYSSVRSKTTTAPAASASGARAQTLRAPSSKDQPGYLDPVADARKYVFERSPRVAGLAHTAPIYDDVTRPTTAPVPAACIQVRGVCKCFSQQATALDVHPDQCRAIVAGGYFQDFDHSPKSNPSMAGTEAARGTEPQASTERVSTGRSEPLMASR